MPDFTTCQLAGSRPKRILTALTFIVLFAGFLLSGKIAASQMDTVSLSGIAGPYSFNRFCRLAGDESWAVGGEGTVIYKDRDETIQKRITDKDLNGVFFKNSDVGWVVGEDGTILHTRDKGSSWQTQVTNVTENIQAITCSGNSTCWAVGNEGVILRTVDEGEHWTRIESGTSALLFAVSFITRRSGWAVGEEGIVLHTSDGGRTWDKQRAVVVLFPDGPFAKPTNLQAVRFIDEKRGWIAGTGGIARTTDGGKSWNTKQLGNKPFIGLVTNDGKILWAISSDGRNYLTKDGGSTWTLVKEENVVGLSGRGPGHFFSH